MPSAWLTVLSSALVQCVALVAPECFLAHGVLGPGQRAWWCQVCGRCAVRGGYEAGGSLGGWDLDIFLRSLFPSRREALENGSGYAVLCLAAILIYRVKLLVIIHVAKDGFAEAPAPCKDSLTQMPEEARRFCAKLSFSEIDVRFCPPRRQLAGFFSQR